MDRRARVVAGLALVLAGNSAFLRADGLLLLVAVLLVGPAGVLLAGWPSRGSADPAA